MSYCGEDGKKFVDEEERAWVADEPQRVEEKSDHKASVFSVEKKNILAKLFL